MADPTRPNPDTFRPPEPQPYRTPDWNPAHRQPFEPANSPNPVDPTRNPWQNPNGPIGFGIRAEFGAGFLTRVGKVGTFAFALLALTATGAFAAAAGGGGGLPWDAPLTAIQTDLSGVTATSISLIALVTVFGVLIFGGELNHFARTLCFIVMAAAVLVAGNGVFGALGIAGATIDGSGGYLFSTLAAAWIATGAWLLVRGLRASPTLALETTG